MDFEFLETDTELLPDQNGMESSVPLVHPDGTMMCDPDSMNFVHDDNYALNGNGNPNHSLGDEPFSLDIHSLHNGHPHLPHTQSFRASESNEPMNLSVDECVTDNHVIDANPNGLNGLNQLNQPNQPIPDQSCSKTVEVSYHDEANGIFGCKHYARNVFIKAECCDQWYVCRLCHDESNEEMDSNEELWNIGDNGRRIKPHKINRYSTKWAKCMRCGTEQKPSKYCINMDCGMDSADNTSSDEDCGDPVCAHPICAQRRSGAGSEEKVDEVDIDDDDDIDNGENDVVFDDVSHPNWGSNPISNPISNPPRCPRSNPNANRYVLARYYCDICKFYDDTESKEIFHCPDCGLCRLGRPGDYIHCKRCGCCLNQKYYEKHPCIENSLQSDCPICFNYLFKSRDPVTFFMPCGHPLHYECLVQYGKVSNLCPICRAKWYDEESEQERKSGGRNGLLRKNDDQRPDTI